MPFALAHSTRHDVLFVSCLGSRRILALDPLTGEPRWGSMDGSSIAMPSGTRTLAVDGDLLFAASFDANAVVVIDAGKGAYRAGSLESSMIMTGAGPRGTLRVAPSPC